MTRSSLTLLSLLIVLAGCGEQQPENSSTQRSSTQQENDEHSSQFADGGNQSSAQQSTGDGTEIKVTHEELLAEMQRYDEAATADWTFVQRPDGLPTGTWQADDRSVGEIVFLADGSFKCQFGANEEEMAVGRYAIADTGLIVAVAKHDEIRLGLYYILEDGEILGSDGPNPHVTWT